MSAAALPFFCVLNYTNLSCLFRQGHKRFGRRESDVCSRQTATRQHARPVHGNKGSHWTSCRFNINAKSTLLCFCLRTHVSELLAPF